MRTVTWLYLEVILVLGTPLFLMGSNPLILAARPLLMVIGGIYCTLMLRRSGVTFQSLGLSKVNFGRSLLSLIKPSLITLAVSLLILIILPTSTRLWFIGVDPLSVPSLEVRLIFYVFGSAPIQEFMFRGYFTHRLEKVYENKWWIVILSTLVFTLSHLPFKSPIMIIVALLMGVFYIFNYLKYRNLYPLTISHALIGATLILVRNFYLPY